MTELDPSLVLKAFATPQLDVGNLLETRQQLKLRNLAQAKAERQESDALAAQQRRQSIGAQAATDPTGARQAAAGAGDFELVQALDKMDEATRKRVTDISRATAPLLMSLKTVSPEQRPAALQGMAPALMERGFSESQVQDLLNGDLSDGKLDTLGNQAMTIEEYNKANEAYTLSPGSKRFQGSKVIAEVPFAPRTISVSPGEEVIEYLPGGGTSSGTGGSIGYDRLIAAEGGTNPDGSFRTSPAGAIGPAQLMPGTAPEAMRLAGFSADDARWRTDPAVNTAAGEAYYNSLREKYGNDALAAAAYNAGPGRVDAALRKGGRDGWINHVPAETQNYVAKVTGSSGRSGNVIARGAPKQGWKTLSPQEATAQGLPPGPVYQQGPNGEVKAVGGTAKAAEASAPPAYSQSAIDAFDRAINTGNDLLKHPGLSTSVGAKGLTGGLLGGWTVPGTDAADFKSNLETMKSQVFLPMVQSMKGMGALSNAEGAKLTAAIGNLETTQSETQFKKNLQNIITDLKTYRDRGRPKAPAAAGDGNIPTLTVEQARNAKPGTRFRTTDGREMVKR